MKSAHARVQFFGSALILLSAGAASAQSLTTLYSFTGGTDGAYPSASLIADPSGALYSTTIIGGAHGYGTVFRLKPPSAPPHPWSETVLYSFAGGSDGASSFAGVNADASGALYGTTYTNGSGPGGAYGTVFKLTPPFLVLPGVPWSETVLHRFTGDSDGGQPGFAGLIADASGALYGTTEIGGEYGWGTVFKLTPPLGPHHPWSQTVLYSFNGGADGAYPSAGLIADASGALYGTASLGGIGYGTVFKLTPSTSDGAWTETVLYSFTNGAGAGSDNSVSGLVADASGALYGTTASGGEHGAGTVFKLKPPLLDLPGVPWSETVLYSFYGGTDGGVPYAGLIGDASGALYGTTFGGGSGYGEVFKLTPPATTEGAWTVSVLHRFTGGDGANPYAGLIADASGALYGTTYDGGGSGCGGGGCGTAFILTGTGFQPIFVGVPRQPNCSSQSIAFLTQKYGGIAAAATTLGYASVKDLGEAVTRYCIA
jgi:uncharacterized repeat protein (TIGR03803 family)